MSEQAETTPPVDAIATEASAAEAPAADTTPAKASEPAAEASPSAEPPAQPAAASSSAPAPKDEDEDVPKYESKHVAEGWDQVFLMVNPSSGGNRASSLMNLPKGGVQVESKSCKAVLYRYSIPEGKPGKKPGFQHLKQCIAECKAAGSKVTIRCIVAGGDGTVMWTISELNAHKIDVKAVAVGVIPYGTANDFSRVTKWGGSAPSNIEGKAPEFTGIKRKLEQWVHAEVCDFDIWQIKIKTDDDGGFKFIDGPKGKKTKQCHDGHLDQHNIVDVGSGAESGKLMTKMMCNYFSIGTESKIGIGFDKLRTKNQILNKGVYAYEGFKKMFLPSPQPGSIIEHVAQLQPRDADAVAPTAVMVDESLVKEYICQGKTGTKKDKSGKPIAHMTGNPSTLLFMNIPSLMGGVDPWGWCKGRFGLAEKESKAAVTAFEQNFGDQQLEFLTYHHLPSLGIEQVRIPPFRGNGNRVWSGKGPVSLKFKDHDTEEYKREAAKCKGRIYIQIDGEFIIAEKPREVILEWKQAIRVLKNPNPAFQCC